MIADTYHNFALALFIWLSPVISESSRHSSGCPILFRLLGLFSLFMIQHDTEWSIWGHCSFSGCILLTVSAAPASQNHHSHSALLPDPHFRRLAQFPVPQITRKLILHHSFSLPSHVGKIFRVLPKKPTKPAWLILEIHAPSERLRRS